MLDLLSRAGAAVYLDNKWKWSWVNNALTWWKPRRAVPRVSHPGDVAAYVATVPYTGDPIGGAADFYIHPERIVAALQAGTANHEPIDCDDFAGLAYVMLRQIPGCVPKVVTLLDESGKFGHHVVCVYEFNGNKGVIDTNGHTLLPYLSESIICRRFSEIYKSLGYRYFAALDSPYPF